MVILTPIFSMAFSRSVCLISCFFATISAYTPLPPTSDAFYQPPSGFQDRQNGDILDSRSIPISPAGLNVSVAATYQILFRTTDSNGLPQAAMTTVLIPNNATNKNLVSVQNAYDSPSINCVPSYELYDPSSTIPERQIIDLALVEGYTVSVPDFEGYQSAFTNGIYSGQVVLDSLRAVLQPSDITGLANDTTIVLAGGSGGALGSEWALELHESYAPEIPIAGALLLALTPNVTSVLQTVDGTFNAPLIPLSLLGLAKFSLELSAWLAENLLPGNATSFLKASEMCLDEFEDAFGTQNVSLTYFGRENALLDDTPQNFIREVAIMGQHGIPRVPIFAYKGTADEVSPVVDTDLLVQKYCDAGSRIRYTRALNVSHPDSSLFGIVAGWPWVIDRMKGIEVDQGCNSTNVEL